MRNIYYKRISIYKWSLIQSPLNLSKLFNKWGKDAVISKYVKKRGKPLY